eukprot:TRINITY_DN15533_c1_g1_i2.p1 TRINITY_DN15533_c1_g1~~TRINITY_DN15533_c1_g1_i2.p1  ORF type:complete len:561 (+),score=164.00 TRINITY_DN15533_c1_g1_i2:78-1760(+)
MAAAAAAAAGPPIGSRVRVLGGDRAEARGWVYACKETPAPPGQAAVTLDTTPGAGAGKGPTFFKHADLEPTAVGGDELAAALRTWYMQVDRRRLVPIPAEGFDQTTKRLDYSVLAPLCTEGGPAAPAHCPKDRVRMWGIAKRAAQDPQCGAAVGALLGLAVGDSVGHPLEFIPVDEKVPTAEAPPSKSRPALRLALSGTGKLSYQRAKNKFELRPGQWTDDCSMALCLADSLLARKKWDGADARMRWHQWWYHGYCNAFRFDRTRRSGLASSVGLGGNIAKSLEEVDSALRRSAKVGAVFGSENEDAGNGSIMRLAPVPIALWSDTAAAESVAEQQSRATHPGPDAAACCRFLAYFICRCIQGAGDAAAGRRGEPAAFLDKVVGEFIDSHPSGGDTGLERLHRLLRCMPPGDEEACWNWRVPQLAIQASIEARLGSEDGTYNGYPVLPGYWGAYCMDGLAMALWAFHLGGGFSATIVRCVNLLGDADTTGAIAGQMAGAFYGYSGIVQDEMGKCFEHNLRCWDPYAEVALRAVLLFHHHPDAHKRAGGQPAAPDAKSPRK